MKIKISTVEADLQVRGLLGHCWKELDIGEKTGVRTL